MRTVYFAQKMTNFHTVSSFLTNEAERAVLTENAGMFEMGKRRSDSALFVRQDDRYGERVKQPGFCRRGHPRRRPCREDRDSEKGPAGSLQNLNAGRKDLTQFLWQLWHNKIDHNTVC